MTLVESSDRSDDQEVEGRTAHALWNKYDSTMPTLMRRSDASRQTKSALCNFQILGGSRTTPLAYTAFPYELVPIS